MAQAVLDDIQAWFEEEIFLLLEQGGSLSDMLVKVKTCFAGGGRVCLMGVFALTETRDHYAQQISGYFEKWGTALVSYFVRQGNDTEVAHAKALDILATIQGGLTLSRARNDASYFGGAIKRLRQDYQG